MTSIRRPFVSDRLQEASKPAVRGGEKLHTYACDAQAMGPGDGLESPLHLDVQVFLSQVFQLATVSIFLRSLS
jgi:hypothetical protein